MLAPNGWVYNLHPSRQCKDGSFETMRPELLHLSMASADHICTRVSDTGEGTCRLE